MASRPKEGIKEKLRTLFHKSKEGTEPAGGGSLRDIHRAISSQAFITPAILRSVGPESDTYSRLKSLSELENLVSTKLLEDGAVENLWLCVQDLVTSSEPAQQRAGTEFITALCKGQASRMGLCRLMFFEHLKTVSSIVEDENSGGKLALYTELLKALCRDGQDVSNFEEEIGPLCLAFLYESVRRGVDATVLLRLLQNLIKLHAGYFDEEAMRDAVRYVCIIACRTRNGSLEPKEEIVACLAVLDAVLCYGCWPGGILLVVVTALCKLINVKHLCEHCWTFMRNLLSSQFGHGTVYTMCSVMQAAETYPDEGVLRGAVCFVGASLWGAQQVDGLRHTPGSVLSSMLRSLASNSVIVAYEVALSVHRLVQKYGRDLQLLTWDLVLQILERIFEVADANGLPPASDVTKVAHETLTAIEQLHETHLFNGSLDQLFNNIEKVSKHRPEGSIMRLMAYRTVSLSPAKGNWLSQLHALLDTYYSRESRSNVRIEAVRILRNLYVEHRHLHCDEMVEVVVLPVFSDVDSESDYEVQSTVINLIVDMAKTSTQNCFLELVGILDRTINDRLETMDVKLMNQEFLRHFFVNAECALDGLIEIIKVKWSSTPATEAVHVLDILTKLLHLLYSRNICEELGSSARSCALKFLLSLCAETGTQKLAYKDPSTGQFVASAYIVCANPEQGLSPPQSPISTTFAATGRIVDFCAKRVVEAFAWCIEKERQWSVIRLLFTDMPLFLLSRRLALSGVDRIAAICAAAIRLCTDAKSALSISQGSERLTTADIKENVFALLTALMPYRSYFDEGLQKRLASTVQGGIVNHKSAFAVISTINCLLEMPDVMAPTIRDLVRRLSELPSAPTIAIPILELLSTLMRMDDLHQTFTPNDFENVFKTLTSYVNPFMLTDYIVAMAYQVLFRWFLRAPLSLRPRLAQYSLKNIAALMKKVEDDPSCDARLRKAYDDAREVSITFLAYYTFTDEPPTYERSPIAQQLFGKNRSRHWTIGDRIFSITPSGNADGCPSCKRKLSESGSVEQPEQPEKDETKRQEFLDKRRRHASAIQGPVTEYPKRHHKLSRDDTYVEHATVGATTQQGWMVSANECSPLCFCWCRDWIELTVRHAVGRQAWVIRIGDGKTKCLVNVDTLAFLAYGGARAWDDEDLSTEEEEDGTKEEQNCGANAASASASTICVDGDEKDGRLEKGSSVLRISIDEPKRPDRNASATGAPQDSAAAIKRRAVQEALNLMSTERVPADVRSVMLQLFSANIGKDVHSDDVNIVALADNEATERAIKNLDRISAYEAHKVGVIYVGLRQTTESEILSNQFGSARYESFLSGLGRLISLKDTDPSKVYLGGLDTNGRDGEFTYHWSDQASQVIFHIATRMPNRETDTNFQQKKLHIGNDFVAIVFNESGYDYKLTTISGQFARVAIIVQPLDEKILHIKLVAKNEISSWLTMKEATMSDELAPLLCRQMSIRADASAGIWEQQKNANGEPFLSRTAERLRQIESIRERFGGKPLTVETMFD